MTYECRTLFPSSKPLDRNLLIMLDYLLQGILMVKYGGKWGSVWVSDLNYNDEFGAINMRLSVIFIKKEFLAVIFLIYPVLLWTPEIKFVTINSVTMKRP